MEAILQASPYYFTAVSTSTVIVVGKDSSGNVTTTEQDSGAGGASGPEELTPFPASDDLFTYNPPDDVDDLYVNRTADYYGEDYQLWEKTFDTVHDIMSIEFRIYGRDFTLEGIMIFSIMVSVLALVVRWAHGLL